MEKSSAVAALGALAQESRLDVFRLLVQAGPEGLPPGVMGERLGLPPATLSFHLTQLRHAGLVTFRREGRSLLYMAEYAAMNDLLSYLTENCCKGRCCRLWRRCLRHLHFRRYQEQEHTPMKRLHIHVSVDDIDQSVRFYNTLFGTEPALTKPDYAKWMLDDPRVNFVISSRGGAAGLDHFGIQVETKD